LVTLPISKAIRIRSPPRRSCCSLTSTIWSRSERSIAGRSLQIFTSSAELYAPDEPITPDNAALKITSRRGHQSRTQPVDVQGGTFFVDRNGTALREYLFSESEQSYTAEPISTLGGHLIQQPIDLALRRSVDTDEPTIVYLVNQGRDRSFNKVPAAALTVDRAQQISAMARITTLLGEFEAVAASQGGDVAFVVQRQLAGNEWSYLEVMDELHMGDHAIIAENPDLETFTATDDQTVFTYTFTNPAEEIDIGVFTRADTLDVWRRVEPDDYTLDTGAKTVTFDTGRDLGTLVAIAPRQTSFSVGHSDLDGIECYLHVDGRATGPHTPSSGSVTILGDEGFWFEARLGLRMVPDVVLQAFKGQGGQSPTMQNQRIFRALLNMERTANVAACIEGQTPKAIALSNWDSGTYDADLEETLFTGQVRVSGLSGWKKSRVCASRKPSRGRGRFVLLDMISGGDMKAELSCLRIPRGLRILKRVEVSEVHLLPSMADVSLPSTALPADTGRAGGVRCGDLAIDRIHLRWNVSQIGETVVVPHPVDMVDFTLRPCSMVYRPDNPMLFQVLLVKLKRSVSAPIVSWCRTSRALTGLCSALVSAPYQVPSCGVVGKVFSQLLDHGLQFIASRRVGQSPARS
jgi:hypothetical protein